MNLNESLERTRAVVDDYHTIVLVEGLSDRLALKTLARRLDLDLDAMGVAIVVMGGATNIGHFIQLLTPHRQDLNITGLYDVGEEHHFQRALERAGFGADLSRSELERLGFFVCEADLEDELIRSVGVNVVLDVATQEDELGPLRKFQMQPEWRDRDVEAQLRRWIGTKAMRKIRYAKLLVNALDLDSVPAPLESLLAHISRLA